MKSSLKILSAGLLLSTIGMVTIACGSGGGSAVHQDGNVTKVTITTEESNASNILSVGDTLALTASTAPDDDAKNLIWASSNPSVGALKKQTVVAKGLGYTKVTASYKDVVGSYLVFVTEHAKESGKIIWNETVDHKSMMLAVGDSFKISDLIVSASPALDCAGIASGEGAITIENNETVTAVGVGDFSITVVAGNFKGNISGKVISEEMGAFVELAEVTAETYNYTAYSFTTGLIISNENTVLIQNGDYDSATHGFTLSGVVYGKDAEDKDIVAPVTLAATETDKGFDFADTFTFDYGFPPTREALGIKGWTGNLAAWKETQFEDEDGNFFPAWYMAETKAKDVDALFNSLFGTADAPWYYFEKYGKAVGVVAMMTGEDDLVLYPYKLNANQEIEIIESVTLSTTPYSAACYVEDIGSTALAATNAWLENPTLPEKLDTSLLSSFFHNITTNGNNYTVSFKSSWEKGQCPSGWYWDAGKTKEVLPVLEYEKRFTPTAILENYKSISSKYAVPDTSRTLASEKGFLTGRKDLYFVDSNRGVYSASNVADSEVGAFNNPKAIMNGDTPLVFKEGEDFSDKAINTYGVLDYEYQQSKSEKAFDYIGQASWTASENNGEATTFSYNFNGPDAEKLVDADNSLYGFFGVMFSGEDLTGTLGWIYYVQGWSIPGAPAVLEVTATVANDLSSMSFRVVLPMDANTEYATNITISNVGTTVMDEEAQALIDAHNASLSE